MNQHDNAHDSHIHWLQDIEYRKEYGSESAKLEMAAALADARELMGITQSALAELAGASQGVHCKTGEGRRQSHNWEYRAVVFLHVVETPHPKSANGATHIPRISPHRDAKCF